MKRRIALLLAVVMILGTFSVAFAESAVENPGEFLEEKGVLKGDLDGNLNLDKPLERRDAVIMLSRLLGVEKEAKAFEEEGLPTWKDITDDNYKGYLAWAQSNKYFQGHNDERFGFREDITVKEYAVVLMRALEYVEEAADWKAAYDKAVELGLLEGVEKEADVKVLRGEMAQMTVNALETKVKDSEETLAEKLEIEMPVPPVVDATKVEEVYAENLKEIVVVFDGEVDRASAELKENYSLDKGEIESARLSEDLTEVLLIVKNDGMEFEKERELTVRNIKAGENKINDKIKFIPADKALPEVVSVEGLGNKAVKITFTEPVKDSSVVINGFKLNGKSFSGTIDKNNDRVVIIKLYSKLAEGSHTLSVSKVEDFAGYKVIASEHDFEVVEDNEAPAIESVEATLEYVTVKFTEPVQKSTVKGKDHAYWKATESTTVKNKSASDVEQLADDTYKFDFSGKVLPGYPVYLYVEGVKDYSDNTIAKDSPYLLEAEIDQTRPEVVYVELDEDNYKEIEVRFSKAMDVDKLKDRANYSLLDEDDKKVSIRKVTPSEGNKVATVEILSKLDEGTYTFKMSGLTDNTVLKNSIMPYEAEFEVGDTERPEVEGVSVQKRQIYIYFSKSMAVDTEEGVTNLDNYFIEYKDARRSLPSDTEVEVLADGTTVVLTFPEEYKKGEDWDLEEHLKSITIQKVEDVDGNQLKGYSVTLYKEKAGGGSDFDSAFKATEAVLKDTKTIEVEFNQYIGDGVGKSDFALSDGTVISDVEVDNNVVILELKTELYATQGVTLKVEDEGFESVIGAKVAETLALEIEDEVAPELVVPNDEELVIDTTTTSPAIVLEFTEAIATGNRNLMAHDFEITRDDGEVLVANVDYTVVEEAGKFVRIELNLSAYKDEDGNLVDAVYTVKLEDAIYVKDLEGNEAEDFEEITEELKKAPTE